jgi:TatD DNase family protein
MRFIDTHCHLNFKAFEGGHKKIMRRARESGVTDVVIPGTDLYTSRQAIYICNQEEGCYAAVGIHPHHVRALTEDTLLQEIGKIEALVEDANVVAIGEIGLDKHVYVDSRYGSLLKVDEDYFQLQLVALRVQIDLAVRTRKSIIIHNRESTLELVRFFTNLLRKPFYDMPPTVLHCCESDMRLLDMAKQYGFYIGVDGDVTFDSKKRDFIRHVPLTQLVLETDSPYILPEPLKSQKKYPNLPSNIPIIAMEVAKIKGVTIEEVAETTTQNAQKLYSLPK